MSFVNEPFKSIRTMQPGVTGNLYNFTPQNFWKFKKAMAKVFLGTGDCKILCIGDSNVRGFGTTHTTTQTHKFAWPGQLATILDDRGYPSVQGLVAPQGEASIADNRVVRSTSPAWSALAVGAFSWASSAGTPLTSYWLSQASGCVLTFTSDVECDSFDIYHFNAATTGNWTGLATGGTAVNITPGATAISAAGFTKTTINAGSLAMGNTLTITTTNANNVWIIGIEPRNSTRKQVYVANAAIAGSGTSHWAAADLSYPLANGIGAIKAYAPDLTIVELGTNDALGSSTTAALLANLDTIANAALVSGDVIFKTMLPIGGAYSAYQPILDTYVKSIRAMNRPVMDSFSGIGPFAAYDTAGYMDADDVHGTDFSAHEQARWVAQVLMGV